MTTADDGDRTQASIDERAPVYPQRTTIRPRARGITLPVALVSFLLGAGLVGALAWHGDLARIMPTRDSTEVPTADTSTGDGRGAAELTSLETRLALMENRFSRLDQQARAAAGNAGRAEGLLIAQATRRAIERGQPLGYLADQLRMRFADAQPRAVETLIAFSQRPVTLSALDARLDTLTPQLANLPREATSWNRMRTALSGLFTIRSDASPTLRPAERIDRAKLLLANGNVEAATEAVARLPGAVAANDWTDDAHRYGAAQQALDVIESAAMITPTSVQNAVADNPATESGAAIE